MHLSALDSDADRGVVLDVKLVENFSVSSELVFIDGRQFESPVWVPDEEHASCSRSQTALHYRYNSHRIQYLQL